MDAVVDIRHSPHAARPAYFSWLRRHGTDRAAVVLLVLLTVLLRIPGIGRPLVGHFATKNVMYAMIARNWALGRSSFWLPATDCITGGGRGWHLLEIPVAAYLAGAGWGVCGGSLDVWGRAVSVAFSTAGVWLLFLLVRRWHSTTAASVAAVVLALSPASIIFGQSFMLESSLIFFMLATIWCTERWLATARARWFSGAAVFLALLLCSKIYMIVLVIPLAVLVGQKIVNSPASRVRWSFGSIGLLVLGTVPAISWCAMTWQFASAENPASEQVYYSLHRSGAAQQMSFSLLLSARFYWRLICDLAGAGVTPVGFVLAGLGMISPCARRHRAWFGALALLVLLLPGKFFELRYYTLVLVPALAVLAGLGWEWLAMRLRAPRLAGVVCLLLGLGCSLRLSVGPAFTTPHEDRAVTAAARAVREMLRPNEPVATLHGAGCDLLYYCDRPGWALSTNDRRLSEKLDLCRRQGGRLLVVADLVSASHGSAAESLAVLPVVCEGDDYRIYRLEQRSAGLARLNSMVGDAQPTKAVHERSRLGDVR